MKFGVTALKEQQLLQRMEDLGIRESDIQERFVKGSGSGGQKINKSSTCVYLRHVPTGIEVKCQRERSQSINRYIARRELCDRIEARKTGEVQRVDREISKIRRQKSARSRKTKRKMMRDKLHRSGIKGARGSVGSDND